MAVWVSDKKYFYEIRSDQVRRGDIFLSRASDGTGYTGLYLDNGKTIIHCTVGGGKRGIMTTPAKGVLVAVEYTI